MFARTVAFTIKPDKIDEFLALYNKEFIPAGREQTGFKGMWLHLDRKTGKALSVTRWDAEANMQTSAAAFLARAVTAARPLLTAEPTVEQYEVVAHS